MSLLSKSIEREWKISQFSTLTEAWKSEKLYVEGYQWQAQLYPKGNGSQLNHSISVFLNFVADSNGSGSLKKVMANAKFCIIDQVNGNHHIAGDEKVFYLSASGMVIQRLTELLCFAAFSSWFSTSSTNWGLPGFLPLSNLNDPSKGLLVKDCCILRVEVTVQAVARDLP